MADTWIVDLTHYLDDQGHLPDSLPAPARKLAEHLCEIVSTASVQDLVHKSPAKCRRRPRRRPCIGLIQTVIEPSSQRIIWGCPVCGDQGYISNWRGSFWDLSGPDTANSL